MLSRRELLGVNEVWAVDPALTSVKKTRGLSITDLSCRYNPLRACMKEEYEKVYLEYCKAIDEILEGEKALTNIKG